MYFRARAGERAAEVRSEKSSRPRNQNALAGVRVHRGPFGIGTPHLIDSTVTLPSSDCHQNGSGSPVQRRCGIDLTRDLWRPRFVAQTQVFRNALAIRPPEILPPAGARALGVDVDCAAMGDDVVDMDRAEINAEPRAPGVIWHGGVQLCRGEHYHATRRREQAHLRVKLDRLLGLRLLARVRLD